jgi:hypothetical protein
MPVYRIIVEVTGKPPLIDAKDAEAAEAVFAEFTRDELLQILTISAERIT